MSLAPPDSESISMTKCSKLFRSVSRQAQAEAAAQMTLLRHRQVQKSPYFPKKCGLFCT